MSTKRTLSDAELFASLEAEQLPELEPDLDLEQLRLELLASELELDLKPLLEQLLEPDPYLEQLLLELDFDLKPLLLELDFDLKPLLLELGLDC